MREIKDILNLFQQMDDGGTIFHHLSPYLNVGVSLLAHLIGYHCPRPYIMRLPTLIGDRMLPPQGSCHCPQEDGTP